MSRRTITSLTVFLELAGSGGAVTWLLSSASSVVSTAARDDANDTVPVCVYVSRRGSQDYSSVPQVRAELARVWRLNGVSIRYPTRIDPQGCDSDAERILVLLVDAPETLGVTVSPDALGVAAFGPGRATMVAVFVERVARVLEGTACYGPGYIRAVSIALMTGRVAAHEVGHVLLGSGSHTREGLMRRSYNREDGWLAPDNAYKLSPPEYALAHANLAARAGRFMARVPVRASAP